VRGAKPSGLTSWLWDFDARPLSAEEKGAYASAARAGRVGFKGGSLIKTDAFLSAHPFGTVPAAFSPDGTTGIFESNSIMRVVAQLGADCLPLYGRDPYETAPICRSAFTPGQPSFLRLSGRHRAGAASRPSLPGRRCRLARRYLLRGRALSLLQRAPPPGTAAADPG
jgi:glutathione S-transferase